MYKIFVIILLIMLWSGNENICNNGENFHISREVNYVIFKL